MRYTAWFSVPICHIPPPPVLSQFFTRQVGRNRHTVFQEVWPWQLNFSMRKPWKTSKELGAPQNKTMQTTGRGQDEWEKKLIIFLVSSVYYEFIPKLCETGTNTFLMATRREQDTLWLLSDGLKMHQLGVSLPECSKAGSSSPDTDSPGPPSRCALWMGLPWMDWGGHKTGQNGLSDCNLCAFFSWI